MSSLTKSLEKRIQELRSSIEAQKAELAAYERVLEVERVRVDLLQTPTEAEPPTKEPEIVQEAVPSTEPAFAGNKTEFIAGILKARGASGATPKEIDTVFSAQAIARSKNLIYNALSFLLKRKKLAKKGGRYFLVSDAAAKPSAAPQKRRISAAGLKRISDANKKRWAALRAAKGRKKPARSKTA
ncbi:MAG TPA: hypothetical protein VGL97_14000 [Bryobacteraceae bacterium]